MFLDVIIGSLDVVPYGIRWISKQIRKLTKVLLFFLSFSLPFSLSLVLFLTTALLVQQKFPDVSAFAVGSLVGSFFMLRFINPAVVTPQAYMLVDQQLSTQARRTTTLVCIFTLSFPCLLALLMFFPSFFFFFFF